jgi:ribulose-bisphosphate carboxylase small chain
MPLRRHPTEEEQLRLTQGTFSYLPDLNDEQISKQVQYALDNGWSISIEYTDDPHPRNAYWEMWGLPMFDLHDAAAILKKLTEAREAHAGEYIKINAYDARLGRQTTALSFIVNRPRREPGFRVERQVRADRQIGYTLHSYAADRPHGERYPEAKNGHL